MGWGAVSEGEVGGDSDGEAAAVHPTSVWKMDMAVDGGRASSGGGDERMGDGGRKGGEERYKGTWR